MQLKTIRRQSRINSLQILYSCEICNSSPNDFFEGKLSIPDLVNIDDYASRLAMGAFSNREAIDKEISNVSINWKLERMPIVDKCLLRQSIFEMQNIDDVPISVSINEAVELAKQFGGDDDSSKFINGILGKVAKNIEANK